MQEVDFYLSLGQVPMVCMKSWVDIEGGKVRQNCVGISERM